MALPRKTAPPTQTPSGFLRRSTPETSLPSVLSPGLLPRKRPLPSGPSEEEQWEPGLRRKSSLRTRGFDAGLPRRVENRSSAAENSRKPSSTPTADSGGGLPRRAGRRKITRTEQQYRDALLREGSNLLQGGASFLEEQAIKPSTQRDYARRRDEFEAASGLATLTVELELLELGLLEHFDAKFLDGQDGGYGAKLVAALGYYRPQLRALSRSGGLARVKLALQGWTRIAPSATRLPLPWPILSAIAVVMKFMGVDEQALCTVLSADAYLRPGEALWLSGDDVIPGKPDLGREFSWTALLLFPEERGRSSKTHKFNESVVLDSRSRSWLGLMVEKLAARRRGQALFNFTYAQWLNNFKSAAARLGLESWELTLYVLRHTGPSHDHLSGARPLPAIQRRGRWALESSVRRYEKSSRVTSRLKDLPEELLAFAHRCDRHLGSILGGSVAVPQLPPVRAKRRKLAT